MGLISPVALVGCSYLDLFIKLPKPHHGALTGCVGVLPAVGLEQPVCLYSVLSLCEGVEFSRGRSVARKSSFSYHHGHINSNFDFGLFSDICRTFCRCECAP